MAEPKFTMVVPGALISKQRATSTTNKPYIKRNAPFICVVFEDIIAKITATPKIIKSCKSVSEGPYFIEPPRVCRRPPLLRGWGYGHEEDDEQIFG